MVGLNKRQGVLPQIIHCIHGFPSHHLAYPMFQKNGPRFRPVLVIFQWVMQWRLVQRLLPKRPLARVQAQQLLPLH